MSTLLLRLAAPLQSWGVDSSFNTRRTERLPSKSGVIGMIAAALGRKREQPVDDLAALGFGVRADQEGKLIKDFQTAKSPENKNPYVTDRYYLSDAVFLVGLESDDIALLETIDEAVQRPVYPLFLGRRSCPPEGRVSLGIRPMGLKEALEKEPWLASRFRQERLNRSLRIRIDTAPDTGIAIVRDAPMSFSQLHRQFGYRAVYEYDIEMPKNENSPVCHDPMAELREADVPN